MVTLSPIDKRHTEELHRLIADPAVGIPANFSYPFQPEDAVKFIQDRATAFEEGNAFTFAIIRHGELVGGCSLHTISWTTRSAEIAFWIGRSHWGQGYASNGVNNLLVVAFSVMRFTILVACCLEQNHRAERILLRSGFSFVESRSHHSPKWPLPRTIRAFRLERNDWMKSIR